MGWELVNNRSRGAGLFVSIHRTGYCNISPAIHAMIGSPRYCEVLFDRETGRIGLHGVAEKQEGRTYTVSRKPAPTVTLLGALRAVGAQTPESVVRCPATIEDTPDGKILAIDIRALLPSPTAEQ